MDNIAVKMESTYELFTSLSDVRVKHVRKHTINDNGVGGGELLEKNDRVDDCLEDGEEVLFELSSEDIWLRIRFNLLEKNKLKVLIVNI
jgi:hypothetical protein